MKKILAITLLILLLLGMTADAITLTDKNKVEVQAGKYEIHYIYRSESYWTTRKYDKEVIVIKEFDDVKNLNFKEDIEEYNYMACMVGTEKDGSTNIYVWYNNYN